MGGVTRRKKQRKRPSSWEKFQRRRKRVFERDGLRCYLCGVEVRPRPVPGYLLATVDHVRPRAKGGKSGVKNMRTACPPCDHRKGDRMAKDGRWPGTLDVMAFITPA